MPLFPLRLLEAGIWLSNCTNIQVTNCNLTNDCYGVYLTQSANNTVINNIILGMYASIGVYSHNSSQNIIQLNNINENFDLAEWNYIDEFCC